MRHVEEALARQVIYGGDFATNLLEIAAVDEGALTQLIAETMRLAPAPPGELPVTAEGAHLVPEEMAVSQGIVPLMLDAEVLVLVVTEPLAADLEERLMFTLGVAIDQRAAPVVRVRQAISRVYGTPLDRRTELLLARLANTRPPPRAERTSTPPMGSFRAGTPQFMDTAAETNAGSMRTSPIPGRVQTSTGFPAARSSRVDPSTPAPGSASPSSAPPLTQSAPERPAGLLQRDVPSGGRSGRRRRGPITLESAKREADEASDRNALLDLFFDFSRQFFDYSALFLVHGDIAEGRDAFGAGANRERVIGIGVPLDLPSLIARARDQRAAVVGNAPADGLDAVLLADLQRPRGVEVAVVPLVVRTRAVAIVIGDCGDAGLDRPGVKEVTTFAAIVGKSLERIIVRRKLEGFVASPARLSEAQERSNRETSRARPSDAKEQASPETSLPGPSAPSHPVDAPTSAPPDSPAPAPRIIMTSTMPPPPANVVTVRRMSGPPIPREEPEPPSEGTEVSRAGPDDAVSLRAIPEGMDARALFDILGWETGAEEPDRPPPSSALAVPPHRPPPGHVVPPDTLPSIIVDVEQELATIVDRIVDGDADESAEGELLRQGERAMRVIMARFPGPLTFERSRIAAMPNPPRASECGPLLRLVARERRVALPFVIERLSDPDPEVRGWATHLLGELLYDDAIPHIVDRMRDPDACTRASAVQAMVAAARVFPDQARDALRSLSKAGPADRAAALDAMARLRHAALVPDLIAALADSEAEVVTAAHDALVLVTGQDFGNDARPWLAWWGPNSSRHRIEWLIDALTNDVSEIRRVAGEELRAITREYFGYSSELPPRDRHRTQQRYRDWWMTEGRTRFRRR